MCGSALKIAIVTEYYYPLVGGITENVHHTATKLREMGHTVKIVTSRVASSGVRASEIPPDAAEIIRIGRSMPLHRNGTVAHVTIGMHLWRDLRDLFARERFDIAQLHSPLVFTLPAMAVIAAKVTKCPRIGRPQVRSTWEAWLPRSITRGWRFIEARPSRMAARMS